MATKINQKEYLKKYLSNDVTASDDGSKKKKKKKSSSSSKTKAPTAKPAKTTNVRIIDDDIDIARLRPIADADLELAYAIGEEAPQIVGVLDDRPAEMIASEDYKQSEKWKVLRTVDGALRVNQMGGDGRVRRSGAVQTLDDDGAEMARRKFTRYDSGDNDDDDAEPERQSKSKKPSLKRRSRTPEKRKPTRTTTPDRSPVRRRGRSRTPDQSPVRLRRNDADDDQSPERRRSPTPVRRGATAHPSKQRRSPSSDQSPVRRRNASADQSPVRRAGGTTTSTRRRSPSSDQSPVRRRTKHSPDQSPVRRRDTEHRRRSRTSEHHPNNRRRRSRSRSPAQRRDARQTNTPDASPPRRRTAVKNEHSAAVAIKREPRSDSDASPPRRNRRHRSPARAAIKTEATTKMSRWSRDRSGEPEDAKMQHTLDGKRAGLQSAEAMRAEADGRRRKEAAAYASMSGEAFGRDAEAVVRDRRTGRVRDVEAELEAEMEKTRKELERKAVYDRWGHGVKQLEAHQAQRAAEQHEAAKPLARYADDADRDALLRERQHADDPMLEYVQQKRAERTAGQPTKPLYRGSFAENRFGLRPGYRWDGVDRSNGFERRWFEVQSKSKATEEETYKYMTEDM